MAHILSEETSLTRRKNSLQSESGALGIVIKIEALIAALLLIAGGAIILSGGRRTLFWCGVAAAFICVGHFMKMRDNRTEVKKAEAGLKGEANVSAALAQLLDNKHYIFNDVLVKVGRKSAQIDHLIVSPRGIFILETKNWRGRIVGCDEDERWKQYKEPGADPILISSPVTQSRRHREVLEGALRRAGIDWPDIIPLVVFMPRTELDVAWTVTPVLHPEDAAGYVRAFKPSRDYDDKKVSAALSYFMKAIGRT